MDPGKIVKKFISKKGNEVTVRYIEEPDLDELLRFANNLISEDTFILLSGNKITREEEQKLLEKWLKQISNGKRIHLVALINGNIVGAAEVRWGEKRKSHVGELGISLAKPYRGEGIGGRFFQTLIEEAKKTDLKLLYLHCFENNTHAIAMYEKMGFKKSGTVPGMYLFKSQYVGEVTYYLPISPSK